MALICEQNTHLGLTWLRGMSSLSAMSSTVSLPSEMMPTPLAMALAVIGWSPVTMITWSDRGERRHKSEVRHCHVRWLFLFSVCLLLWRRSLSINHPDVFVLDAAKTPAKLVNLWDNLLISEILVFIEVFSWSRISYWFFLSPTPSPIFLFPI